MRRRGQVDSEMSIRELPGGARQRTTELNNRLRAGPRNNSRRARDSAVTRKHRCWTMTERVYS